MKNAYVSALTNSVISGLPIETVLSNTKALLKKRGHERLWSQVLRASYRVLEAKLKQQSVQVKVASSVSYDQATLRRVLDTLGATADAYETTIDQTLIGGFTARFHGKLIDQSYKRALLNLYRKITK